MKNLSKENWKISRMDIHFLPIKVQIDKNKKRMII